MIITKLQDYGHFIELTNKFDYQYNTKTFLLKISLKKCNDLFLRRNMVKTLNYLIRDIFKEKSIIKSHDDTVMEDYLRKLYTLSELVKNLQNNSQIKDPLSLHYFGGYKAALSPGFSRMYFCHQYVDDVNIIFTDYSNTDYSEYFFNDYNINIIKINENSFDCTDLSFLENDVKDDNPKALWKVNKQCIRYKQCINSISIGGWYDIKKLKDLYVYEYKNNAVFVNDLKILYKKNDKWYFNI